MDAYQALELKYAGFVNSDYAVSCNSGTSALHLALLALGVGKGDEVIVPNFTMAACAFAVSYTGATPVFVDVEIDTYGLDPVKLKKAITKRTKAIMVVHVYGRLARMGAILEVAGSIPVVEDACEAHGVVANSKAAVTCWSFYRNKIIHAEEGGMLTTNSKEISEKANYYKNMCFTPEHDYHHNHIGFNYRMTNNTAELVMKSMDEYPDNNKKRREIEDWYRELLEMDQFRKRDAVWFYEVSVNQGNRAKILKTVHSARSCFKPLSTYPMYKPIGKFVDEYPITNELSSRLVLLPANPKLSRGDVEVIADNVNTICRK